MTEQPCRPSPAALLLLLALLAAFAWLARAPLPEPGWRAEITRGP